MDVKPLMPAGIALFLALGGTAAERQETVWPEPRPLGREVPVSRAPDEPAPLSRPPVEEPDGRAAARGRPSGRAASEPRAQRHGLRRANGRGHGPSGWASPHPRTRA